MKVLHSFQVRDGAILREAVSMLSMFPDLPGLERGTVVVKTFPSYRSCY